MKIDRVMLLASASPAALLVAGGAQAAPPAPMPPVVMPTTPSWTGCYVGANGGWGWGHQHVSETYTDGCTGTNPFGPDTQSGAVNLQSSGGLFGGQVGCNYQFSGNWVAGGQFKFDFADINGFAGDPINPINDRIAVKTTWLASLTARLGMTVLNNEALLYGKAGVAWDHNQWDLTHAYTDQGTPTETRTGLTVGGGAEFVLWSPLWTGFVEFDYYRFGKGNTFSTSSSDSDGFFSMASFSTGSQTIETVTAGVNVKFSGP